MEILLDLVVTVLLAPDIITRTGKWVLSLVGLKANALVENVVGQFVWVLSIVLIVCVLALAVYCWSVTGRTP